MTTGPCKVAKVQFEAWQFDKNDHAGALIAHAEAAAHEGIIPLRFLASTYGGRVSRLKCLAISRSLSEWRAALERQHAAWVNF
ncbi:MAG TPA: hypothetical protein VNC39_16215 [Acidocella sp.]|uniref:hypothetical protein n=1 Tax=Acidocella sp. TaxID=50710 RepID=UPI002C5622C7|nr:hypothetical protein [Acidocella sp.]HVE23517.1 hypothetical protein [Acidocella sp.]